jgi:8-oxo-dGTP pyrophosphatase MutT (NUDIX family)
MSTRQQSGCVVFRYDRNFRYEVLLVKSSDGKDWVFPKGGVEKHLSSRDSAAKEVYEEAGVAGNILNVLGSYRYRKQGRDQNVVMYAMHYTNDTPDWPEKKLRKRKWFPLKDAKKKVPSTLKPLLSELSDAKMLALSANSHLQQAAQMLRELPVITDNFGEIEVGDEDTVTVVMKSGNDTMTMRIEDWGQHPQIDKLTIHYDYTRAGTEAAHFKHSNLGQIVGHVSRIIGRFLSGDL